MMSPSVLTKWEPLAVFQQNPSISALGFEMLEGLQTGTNITWSVSYQRTLKEHMQLSINYDGKASREGPIVHRGGIQLRAFF